MTTLNVAVSASADDADESTTGVVNTTSLFTIIVDHSAEWIGLRFQNVTIPQGATINSASFSCVPEFAGVDEPLHPIYCEDVDNSAAFDSGNQWDISGRTRTTATVTWDVADLGATGSSRHSSVDISALVQEVVDRAGWVSGNALTILINGSSGTRDLSIFTYDKGSRIPEFDVDYTAGGGGGLPVLLEGGTLRFGFQNMSGGL